MKTIEFKTTLHKNKITIPKDVQRQLEESLVSEIRVMLLLDDDQSNSEFMHLSRDQFLKGYSEKDSIYDNYK